MTEEEVHRTAAVSKLLFHPKEMNILQSTTDNSDFAGKVNKCELSNVRKTDGRIKSFYLRLRAPGNEISCRCVSAHTSAYLQPSPPGSPPVWRDCCTLTKEPRKLELGSHVTAPEHTVHRHPSQSRCLVLFMSSSAHLAHDDSALSTSAKSLS